MLNFSILAMLPGLCGHPSQELQSKRELFSSNVGLKPRFVKTLANVVSLSDYLGLALFHKIHSKLLTELLAKPKNLRSDKVYKQFHVKGIKKMKMIN